MTEEIRPKRLYDWITYAEFALENANDVFVYIQTAHNTILSVSKGLCVVGSSACEEQSILYSGTILPQPEGDALIAAGTVLGGVVIWRLSNKALSHNFTHHEGSIFGVRFSEDGRYLVSCSDDRSIRLWCLETGKEIAVGWGHLARIWDLHFIGNDTIVSVSEDCTAKVWGVQNAKLVCTQTFEGHLGRNAWAGSINYDEQVLATGGSDGRVRLWDLKQLDSIDQSRLTWYLTDVTDNVFKNEAFKEYVYVGNSLLVATSSGRAFVLKNKTDWTELSDLKLDVYSSLTGWEEDGLVCTCTRDGIVNILDLENFNQVQTARLHFGGKVSRVLPFKVESRCFFLAATQNPNDPFIIRCVGEEYDIHLQPPKTFPVTSVFYDPKFGLVILGSRHGAVAAYKVDFTRSTEDRIEPVFCYRRVMSEDAVTSIVDLNGKGTLHLTSRMGHYASVRLVDRPYGLFMEKLTVSKIQQGTIEGCKIVNGRLLFYGFRNLLFFVWNETDQYEILNEKCGGAHRNWYIDVGGSDERDIQLIYTKAGKIIMLNSQNPGKFSGTLLERGTHGREIRDVSISPSSYDGFRVLATASEDTCVKLGTLSATGEVNYHCTLRQHVSGIQSGKFTPDGRFYLSSGAMEEFIVWKVDVVDDKVYSYSFATIPSSTDVPDLRIMDFDLVPLGGNDKYLLATVYSDSTIKIWVMDLMASKNQFELLSTGSYRTCCLLNCDILMSASNCFLAVSSTDGHLAIWNITAILGSNQIDIVSGELQPKATSYTLVAFPNYIERLQIHQSSVKSSIYLRSADNTLLHVSGGDDNALWVSSIQFEGPIVSTKKVSSIGNAHSATIVGITKVSENDFVTTSVDQNVKKWAIDTNNDISLVESKYTTVADTGPIDSTQFNNSTVILFAGSGLSAWKIET
ncbi:hypothetical protein TRICI_001711 [Trichomonascus ciferrii]|uniref:Anaphase-promoting complex subunit 4 WD40 domain-containing protein n=1 Tax=Trichomonascus ciferrii TaxID=44093 RepID=A0A642V973_9ASCO|nr:hypothetical protein TRICI_001711 [Trichomonascus ciferrii]